MTDPRELAFDLGPASESYTQNIATAKRLPGAPTLMITGVNVGQCTSRPPCTSAATGLTGAALTLAQVDDVSQHRFSSRYTLEHVQKCALLTQRLHERYPALRERFACNAAQLRGRVAACRERGFKVVLVNLPLSRQVIRHRMDTPRARHRRDCTDVSTAHVVSWVDFVSGAGLVSTASEPPSRRRTAKVDTVQR